MRVEPFVLVLLFVLVGCTANDALNFDTVCIKTGTLRMSNSSLEPAQFEVSKGKCPDNCPTGAHCIEKKSQDIVTGGLYSQAYGLIINLTNSSRVTP